MKCDSTKEGFNNIDSLNSKIDGTKSAKSLITMMDNVNFGILLINRNMEIAWINRVLKTQFPEIDISQKPLYYESFHNIVQKEAFNYCSALKVFKTGKTHSAKHVICNDGRTYNIISTPIKDRNEEIIYVMETMFEITNRNQNEK